MPWLQKLRSSTSHSLCPSEIPRAMPHFNLTLGLIVIAAFYSKYLHHENREISIFNFRDENVIFGLKTLFRPCSSFLGLFVQNLSGHPTKTRFGKHLDNHRLSKLYLCTLLLLRSYAPEPYPGPQNKNVDLSLIHI